MRIKGGVGWGWNGEIWWVEWGNMVGGSSGGGGLRIAT